MGDRQGNEFPRRNQYNIQPYAQSDVPSTYVNYQAPEEEVHLRDYLGVIMKRKWVVLSFLLSVVIITMVITFTTTPQYKSTAVIRIAGNQNDDPLKILQGKESPDYYQTQYEILKSDALAEKVIRKLDLDKNPNFITTNNVFLQAIGRAVDFVVDGVSALQLPRTVTECCKGHSRRLYRLHSWKQGRFEQRGKGIPKGTDRIDKDKAGKLGKKA
jgi:hypothetical protein